MVDCTGFIEPLNLECLLVNTFAGSDFIFFILATLAIAALSAYFRMSNSLFLVMFVLFGVIFASFASGIYVFIVLMVGLIIFAIIKKIASTQ